MSDGSISGNNPDGIFDLGNILGRLGDSALNTFDEVAPVWANKQLGMQSSSDKGDRPTFQETFEHMIREGVVLTTGGDPENGERGVMLDQNMLILAAGAIFLGFVIFSAE